MVVKAEAHSWLRHRELVLVECLATKRHLLPHSHKPQIYEQCRRDRKSLRARSKRGWEQNSVFWTQQECWPHELFADVAVGTRLARDQATYHSSTEQGGLPTLISEEPLIADSLWGRESSFSLRVQSLVGQPCPSGWSHTREHMGTTNRTQWAPQTREVIKLGERRVEGWISEELGKEIWGEYDTNKLWNYHRSNKNTF